MDHSNSDSLISIVNPGDPQKVLITGAGGFLGSAIAKQALIRGIKVKGLARGSYPHLSDLGIEMIRGDLADQEVVLQASEGCNAIFHVAAKAGAWGSSESYYRSNVLGTRHVIHACQHLQIPKLIFTSSPSVIHNHCDIEGEDESLPYPSKFLADYPATKAQAEQDVLAANSKTLTTIALRPHLIWGPGDQHLIPRLLDRARKGRLRHLAPHKMVDSIYIDDAATAHWNAFDHMQPQAQCAGKAYFISQGEPWSMQDLINGILQALGEKPVYRTFPPKLAYFIGTCLEIIYKFLGKEDEPVMTRFIASQLSTAHWYTIAAARRDFGFEPRYSIQDALTLLKQSKELASKS